MVDLDLEIMDYRREVEGQVRAADEDPLAAPSLTVRISRSSESHDSASGHDLWETQHRGFLVPDGNQDHVVVLGGDRNGEPNRRTTNGKGKEREFPQGDPHAQFYEHYRKEAEEYDRELMKKYNKDLNMTLIFAGLLSASTSAFLIQIHPLLQPYPTDETAVLLRVLLDKMDNAMFGGNTDSLPQWTGAPRTIIQVQAMLYASLAASVFSAFLAVLCKQRLNRCASTGMRGDAIERSRDLKRRLDGIVTWYFDHVMGSLPVILRLAFLLLGGALSRYHWETDVTVARVVLGVTVFGVIF